MYTKMFKSICIASATSMQWKRTIIYLKTTFVRSIKVPFISVNQIILNFFSQAFQGLFTKFNECSFRDRASNITVSSAVRARPCLRVLLVLPANYELWNDDIFVK